MFCIYYIMEFQIISDLHLEYYYTLPDINKIFKKAAPNLILTGDICYFKHPNFLKFFSEISKMYKYIYFVPGNHEYYSHYEIPDCCFSEIDYIIEEKLKNFKNVYFLQKNYIELDNIIIGGATMWCETNKDLINHPHAKILTNDCFMKLKNKYIPVLSKIKKINKIHTRWLEDFIKISNEKNKKVIVLTHYLPSIKCINKKYKFSPINEFYYTSCDHLFKRVDYWIAGHTHHSLHIKEDGCHIIINPVGTPDEETSNYNKSLVIHV